MNDLVFLASQSVHTEPFTTSDIIAEHAEVSYRSVQRQIERYWDDLSEFGRVRFEITPFETKGGIQQKKIYHLNEQQAMLLFTYLKNTAPVRGFKKELVRQFYAMRLELFRRRSERELLKSTTADMAECIKQRLPDSPHKSMQYLNFINLSYRTVCGKSAKKLRAERGAPSKAIAADFLTADELQALHTAQGQIAALLGLGMDYAQIKEIMSNQPARAAKAG